MTAPPNDGRTRAGRASEQRPHRGGGGTFSRGTLGLFRYVVLKCSASHALSVPVCAASSLLGVYTTFHE